MAVGVLLRESHCKSELVVVVQQMLAHVVQGIRLVLVGGIPSHGGRGSSARPTSWAITEGQVLSLNAIQAVSPYM